MSLSFEDLHHYGRALDASSALRSASDGGADFFAIEARTANAIERSAIGDFVRSLAAKADEREAIGRRNEEAMRYLGRR